MTEERKKERKKETAVVVQFIAPIALGFKFVVHVLTEPQKSLLTLLLQRL